MATYKAYDDIVLGYSPLAYWRLTDASAAPFPDLSPNGRDIDGLGQATTSSTLAFTYAPQSTMIENSGEINYDAQNSVLSVIDAAGAMSAMNTAEEATLIVWCRCTAHNLGFAKLALDTGNNVYLYQVNTGTSLRHSDFDTVEFASGYALADGEIHMVATMMDATTDYLAVDGEIVATHDRASGVWENIVDFLPFAYNGGGGDGVQHLAYSAVFDRTFTSTELNEMYNRRKFQGKIAGTMTLDGSPTADATVRSFRRSDGRINGETTSAGDGTYEITVLDNVECDLLAIPPNGVAARPLAHGPIVPDPYEQ